MRRIRKELGNSKDLAGEERKSMKNRENIMLKIESIYVSYKERIDKRKREEKNYQKRFCEECIWKYFDKSNVYWNYTLKFLIYTVA